MRALRLLGLGLLLAGCAARGLSPHPGPVKPAAKPTATPSPAPTPAQSFPQRRPVDESRPVQVRSRSLRYDQAAQESVFYGGVTVTQDSTQMLTRELRSETQGRSAHASGGVQMSDPVRRFRADSDSADYTDAMRYGRLDGGVRLVSVDPYGVPVTVTGRSGEYADLSRWAQVLGGVTVLRGSLSATAQSAVLEGGGTLVDLSGTVRAALGFDRCRSAMMRLDQATQELTLIGNARAHFVPRDLRQAMATPWKGTAPGQEAP
jgi:lipopolysaccharide export system protein LptA